MLADIEDEEPTPKPKAKKMDSDFHLSDVEEDEDQSEFISPFKARKMQTPVPDVDTDSTEMEDDHPKAKEKKKPGKQAFRQRVQEKRAPTFITQVCRFDFHRWLMDIVWFITGSHVVIPWPPGFHWFCHREPQPVA